VGFVACGASIAGVVYPSMTRYLIDSMGFNNAVRLVSTLVAVTSLFSLIFSRPNPEHTHPRPQSYRRLRTWIDPDAMNNKAFIWFTIAVAFLFFGFYPVFFNLEEVRPRLCQRSSFRQMANYLPSGLPSLGMAHATVPESLSTLSTPTTSRCKHSGS
jgi:predicted MFS family arabinose efflux permease